MPWWLTLYCCVVPLPAIALVGHYGWEAGSAGHDVSDNEELRAAALIGALWPLFLALLAVFVVPFLLARLLDGRDDQARSGR